MKLRKKWLAIYFAAHSLTAQAAGDAPLFDEFRLPAEQVIGHGQSVLWSLPNLATQYLPEQPTPTLQAAIAAQAEGRILDAQIMLEEARKSMPAGSEERSEADLLNASFLLQGNQPQQALELLAPHFNDARRAADAHALASMAMLERGAYDQAIGHAQQALATDRAGFLPNMAMSYSMQGAGQQAEAYGIMVAYNRARPDRPRALAREAELALMLDRPEAAQSAASRAHRLDAKNPYVSSVYGQTLLIDGRNAQASEEFDIALKADPRDAKALLGKALTALKRGDTETALRLLEQAHDSDPNNAIILSTLGAARQQAGQADAAMADWRRAQELDPRDPAPWLHEARAELRANRPAAAREAMREARARMDKRSVYRGSRLLQQDAQLYQAVQADIQRQLGMPQRAAIDLSTLPCEKDGTTLRNVADLLQGQRFGESARRSLLLQSQFDALPGRMPEELDVYGDGAGQTGATAPQHGEVSNLTAQRLSYNDYDGAFAKTGGIGIDATAGGNASRGGQFRLGAGGETLGVSLALRQYRTDGFNLYDKLDNSIAQGALQWRPSAQSQAFLSHQRFSSRRDETFYPADILLGAHAAIADNSEVTRLGLRQEVGEAGELRALLARQITGQIIGYQDFSVPPLTFSSDSNSLAEAAELQYRHDGEHYETQWGAQQLRGRMIFTGVNDMSLDAQRAYANWQYHPDASWLIDTGLGWGRIVRPDNLRAFTDNSTRTESWLPQLGLAWMPGEDTRLNLAVWQGLGIAMPGDASLAPATLAGIPLARPGDEGKRVQSAALAGWQRLGDWSLEAHAQRRDRAEPVILGNLQDNLRYRMDSGRLALHWQPVTLPLHATLAQETEKFEWLTAVSPLDSTKNQQLHSTQLQLRWFANEHWTLGLDLSSNAVSGMQTSMLTPELPYSSAFGQADASVEWKAGRAALAAGLRNIGNVRFQYADPDRLNPRYAAGRLVYLKARLDW